MCPELTRSIGQTKAGCGGRPRWMSAVIDVRIWSLPRPGRNHFTTNGVPFSLAAWTTPWNRARYFAICSRRM